MIGRIGRKAIVTGILCTFVPLVSAVFVYNLIALEAYGIENKDKLTAVTATHALTAFPVVALLLEDLKIINSELGRLSLSATLVCDILGVCLQTLGRSLSMTTGKAPMEEKLRQATSIVYVLSVVLIFRPIMLWVVRQTPDNRPVKKIYLNALIMLVLLSGVISYQCHMTFHFGPLVLGLAVPAGRPLGSAVEEKFHVFVYQVFLPVFVTTYAMRADFSTLDFGDEATRITAILIVFIFVVKILATMVTPLYYRMPLNDAFVIGLILSCRGIIHLACYTVYRDIKVRILLNYINPKLNIWFKFCFTQKILCT